MATPRGPRRLSRAASSGAVKPGCVQAWIELRSDDPEAVSALAVARARVGGGQALLGLRRLRLFELSGTLPATAEIEDLLGFALPGQARLHQEWWTDADNPAASHYSDSWTLASRTAVPNLMAQTVVFERG